MSKIPQGPEEDWTFASPSVVPGFIDIEPLDGGAPLTIRPEAIQEIRPCFSDRTGGLWTHTELFTAHGVRKVNASLEQIAAAIIAAAG